MRKYSWVLCIVLFLFLSSCTQTTPVVIPEATPESSESLVGDSSYPASPSSPSADEQSYPASDRVQVTQLAEDTLPESPVEAPETSPDTASISGVLFSHTIRQVVPETMFYLVPAVGPEKKDFPPALVAPDAARGEIAAVSDEKGNIELRDIPPGNYYLIVWAPMNWSIAQVSPEDETSVLLELDPGERLPLGVVYLSWP